MPQGWLTMFTLAILTLVDECKCLRLSMVDRFCGLLCGEERIWFLKRKMKGKKPKTRNGRKKKNGKKIQPF